MFRFMNYMCMLVHGQGSTMVSAKSMNISSSDQEKLVNQRSRKDNKNGQSYVQTVISVSYIQTKQ